MKTNTVILIARNEFANVIRNPVTYVMLSVIAILMLVNISGGPAVYDRAFRFGGMSVDSSFLAVLSNFMSTVLMLFVFLTMCLGLLSLSKERTNGSLRILLMKPVYRRDVIIGKYVGIGSSLFLIISIVIVIEFALLMAGIRPAGQLSDISLRVAAYVVIFFIYCMFYMSIIMFFGAMFKNLVYSLIISLFFIFIETFNMFQVLFFIDSNITTILEPKLLFSMIIAGNTPLFMASTPFDVWISNSLPYIVLMLIETTLVMLATIHIFNKEDV